MVYLSRRYGMRRVLGGEYSDQYLLQVIRFFKNIYAAFTIKLINILFFIVIRQVQYEIKVTKCLRFYGGPLFSNNAIYIFLL